MLLLMMMMMPCALYRYIQRERENTKKAFLSSPSVPKVVLVRSDEWREDSHSFLPSVCLSESQRSQNVSLSFSFSLVRSCFSQRGCCFGDNARNKKKLQRERERKESEGESAPQEERERETHKDRQKDTERHGIEF